jgi:hypothetical protein
MDRQSEWITLRHVYTFLKSRGLTATASHLEREARLRFDYPRVRALLSRGRWRAADEYVSSFLGDNPTPEASAVLFLARFQRLVRALRRGDRAWASRYFYRSVEPVLANHRDEAKLRASCLRALRSDPRSLRRDHPDDARSRQLWVAHFTGRMDYVRPQGHLYRCDNTFVCDKFMRIKATRIVGLRRLASPPRRSRA